MARLGRVLPPSGRLTVSLCPRKTNKNGASWPFLQPDFLRWTVDMYFQKKKKEIVEDVLARGWIGPCPASEWASNGFVVPKKEEGKWRLVVDYRQLNETSLPDAHPLLFIGNMLENQSKHKILLLWT